MGRRPLTCRPLDENPASLVRRHLAEPRNAWSVGTYGALGEFEYALDEPDLAIDLPGMSIRSRRGALRIDGLAEVKVFALVDEAGRTREIAFCTTRRGAGRTCITALDALTFDVGLGVPHIDMLVRLRADDSEAADVLRAAAGQGLFAPGNPAGAAIARASPCRILVSPIATLEVDQPIPPPGGRSAEGPHTHLLPKFLAQGLVHPPDSPLPEGLYCGLSLYPRAKEGRAAAAGSSNDHAHQG
jgi:hypothetical protein